MQDSFSNDAAVSSVLLLNQVGDEPIVTQKAAAVFRNSFSADDGFSIYLRACYRILALLDEITAIKQMIDGDANVDDFSLMWEKINHAHLIIHEFKKGFGIIHEDDNKQVMQLLHERFCFAGDRLSAYSANYNIRHLDDLVLIIQRCIELFEQLKRICEEKVDEGDVVVADVQVSA